MFNPVEWFSNLGPEWATFLISMIPITELRASIPIAIEVYKLPVWQAWLLAVCGDMLPAVFILFFAPYAHKWVLGHHFLGIFFDRMLSRAERAFSGKYARYGALALVIFVGIPLPLTGSWTGSLAAFVFNIPFKKSFFLILAGVAIAASLVTFITLFAGSTLRWLL